MLLLLLLLFLTTCCYACFCVVVIAVANMAYDEVVAKITAIAVATSVVVY